MRLLVSRTALEFRHERVRHGLGECRTWTKAYRFGVIANLFIATHRMTGLDLQTTETHDGGFPRVQQSATMAAAVSVGSDNKMSIHLKGGQRMQ